MSNQVLKQPENIILYRGIDFTRALTATTFTDGNDTAADITGATALEANIYKSEYSSTVVQAFSFVITTAASGVCTISLTGAQTELLDFNNESYFYSANLTMAAGEILLVAYGSVKEIILQ